MKPQIHLAMMALAAAALSGCGGGGDSAPTNNASTASTSSSPTQDVSVQFAAVVGSSAPVDCASTLAGLGAHGTSAQLRDLRLYLSNVRLVSSTGTEVPITLTQNDYQLGQGSDSAVLIDLTDTSTGACALATDGSAQTNRVIVGKVPPGTYVRFKATVGLPDALNHSDTMTAQAPLDNMAMGWSWQNGRKFIKLELDPTGGVSTGTGAVSTYNVHIASTGCSGGNNASATCTNGNMVGIDIALNPSSQQVALDLNEVFRGVDITTNANGAVGCMSASSDTDCTNLFVNLGLNLVTGAVNGTQQVFRAISR